MVSISPEIPEIKLIDNCNGSIINNRFFEYRKPTDKSTFSVKIPIKRIITFEYTYLWVSGQKTQVITNETKLKSNIDLKKVNEISTCKESVAFIPEENKHYEIPRFQAC